MENTISFFKQPLTIVPVFGAFMIAVSATAQCPPHWEAVGVPDPTGTVRAMITHNDGSGSALYVGGSFGTVSGTPAVNIARISNGVGQALGDGLVGTVNALAVFDDGTGAKLYAGGSFVQSGSMQVLSLAAWNGATWSPVGGGTNGTVYALAAHNDGSGNALFVGGQFSSAGGTSVSNIARWNGSAWNNLGGGVTGPSIYYTVNTLLSRTDLATPVLYAAGQIASAGGIAATPVVAWNGSAWSNVGNDATGNTTLIVNALAMYDAGNGLALHRGCSIGTSYLLNNAWFAISTVTNVNSLQVHHDGTARGTLYIGTSSSNLVNGQYTYRGLLKYDGSPASGTGLILDGYCQALSEVSTLQGLKLVVGGPFTAAGGIATANLAYYRPAQGWEAAPALMNGGTVTGYVQSADHALTYVSIFGDGGPGVGKVQSGSVAPMQGLTGLRNSALDLETMDINGVSTLVAAGGLFVSPSPGRLRDVLAWQNDVLIALPWPYSTLPSFTAGDLCISFAGGTPSLLLGGRFHLLSGGPYHGILRYSSAGISPVTPEPHPNLWVDRMVTRMTPQGECIYVTSVYFTNGINGPPVFMMSPDGTWTTINGTMTYQGHDSGWYGYCLAWFDDDDGGHLYIGGQFDTLNGQPAHGIARVVGTTLEPLAQSVDGSSPFVRDLMVFDDGSGPALYAAGRFESAGGVAANNIARFRNGQWSAVAGGVTQPTGAAEAFSVDYRNPPIIHLKTISDSTGEWLYAMGNFMMADGQYSPEVARYGRCRCPSDFNQDNAVDFFDYLDFVQAFASNDPSADFNHDSVIDFFDYLDFVAAFSSGC